MRVLLNLLPEDGRIRIRREYYNRFFFWQSIGLFLIVVFLVCLLWSILFILREDYGTVERGEADRVATQTEVKELGLYEEKFREVNRIAAQSNSFDQKHLRWTELFRHLDRLVPEGIALTSLSTRDYQIAISGRALSRNDFLELEKRLGEEDCFTNIEAPVSNLFSEKNVDFQIDFSVKESCIKGEIR